MGCMFFWVKIGNVFVYFVVSCLLARLPYCSMTVSKQSIFDCKIKLCLGRQEKYIFTQESFYLQGIFSDITEEDTSLLDCKHKHMMKSGAPPDKVGVLHCLLLENSIVSQAELISKSYHSLVPGLIIF